MTGAVHHTRGTTISLPAYGNSAAANSHLHHTVAARFTAASFETYTLERCVIGKVNGETNVAVESYTGEHRMAMVGWGFLYPFLAVVHEPLFTYFGLCPSMIPWSHPFVTDGASQRRAKRMALCQSIGLSATQR